MADIFREVDDMMKQERLEKFWKQNALWIIAFVVLTIVGTAAYSGYTSWNNGVKERQTAQLLAMFDEPDFPQGLEAAAKNFRAGLRGIALLGAAQHQMDAGKSESALEFYNLAANDSAIPDEFRDMGTLMSAKIDGALTPDQKQEKLETIYNNAASPWQYHAWLEAALIEAHDKGNYSDARIYLERIIKAQGAVPQTLIAKAQQLEHVYAIKQKETAVPTDKKGS